MSNHDLHSNRNGLGRSTLNVNTWAGGWVGRLTLLFLVGGFWMGLNVALAEDPKTSSAEKPEKATEATAPETSSEARMSEKEANLLSLMMQIGTLSEDDPNSSQLDELMKELERVSAELTSEIKAANPEVVSDKPVVIEKPVAKPSTKAKSLSTPAAQEGADELAKALETLKALESQAAPVEQEAKVVSQPDKPNQDEGDRGDQIIQLKMKENILDLNYLIGIVGKEMKFNFLFDTDKGITGRLKMQNYGEIRYRDLLPLLESFLSFSGYTMVREDPFVRIVKRDEANKKAQPLVVLGDEVPVLEAGDSVVAQIVEIKHIPVADAKNFLKNFADDKTMVPVPKTNYLIITEYAHRLERLLSMLALVDQPGAEVRLETLSIKHADVNAVNKQILELLKNLNQQTATKPAAAGKKTPSRRSTSRNSKTKAATPAKASSVAQSDGKGGLVLIVDERLNRMFVIGSDDEILQVKDLLVLLDVPDGPPIRLVPIEVKHVLADEVAQLIISLIQDINKDPGETSGGSRPVAKPAAKPGTSSRPPSSRSNSRNSSQALKAGENGPFLHIDKRTNRLLLIGSDEQIEQVKDLLVLLDVPDGPPIRLVPIEVKHVLADEVGQLIISLIQDINKEPGETSGGSRPVATPAAKPGTSSRTPSSRSSRNSRSSRRGSSQALKAGENGPFLHIDERTNRLLLIGSDEQIDQVLELLVLLDIPPRDYEKLVLRVYRPEYVEAEEVNRILSDLGIIVTQRRSARQRGRDYDRGRDSRNSRDDRSRDRSLTGDRTSSTRPGDPALLPGEEEAEIRIAVQDSTNKIFILATEKQHADIKDIMDQVDLDGKDAMGEIQIYSLENRDPEFVASMLIELMESTYTESSSDAGRGTRVPGAENAPIVVALDDIYAVAVRGSKKQHDDIRGIIEILDKRLPSVLVEAILIQVSVDNSLGVGVFLQQDTTVTNDAVNPRRVSGISPFNLGSLTQIGNVIAGNGATIAFFDDDKIFATLEALEQDGNSRIVSRPRILVNDNETGFINSEDQQPTTTTTIPTGSNVPIIDFSGYESAGTKLTISPHIGSNESNSLQLEISLNVDSFVGEGSGNVPPPKVVNTIETFVTVPDGMTMVLGGLIREVDAVQVNKIPILGDLPLIGFLFRNTSRSKDRSILYVFLKAHIVGREGLEEDFSDLKEHTEKAQLKLKENKIKGRDLSVVPGIPDKKFEIESDLFDD